MKETYLSTREVAALLEVTETTIKRWSDSGHLECVKTLGGHRKFALHTVEQFAKDNNIKITGATAPLSTGQKEKLSFAVFSNNLKKASEVIFEEALQGDREGMFESLLYMTKNQIKYADIVDEIITPALERIGVLWEKKKLTVEEEHLASDTLRTALGRLVVHLPHSPKRNIKVICACPPGEYHDIGLQSLAYNMEMEGFRLHYLGANTPFESIINAAKRTKPKFILISATAPNISREEFIRGIKKISGAAKAVNTKVVLGGNYVQDFTIEELGCYAVYSSIKEAVSLLNKKKL